ncbi:MAG: hypothetical protein WAO69_07160 [Aestuariivita sp.]|uniref:hypothetical protein n=1 Tax=Aestuariivita sp. TaxID=1872407 RepID=UPI003BAF519B
MTINNWKTRAESLEWEIERASASTRLALQPRLEKFLAHLEADGIRVPRRLKKLNSELIDEAIEARFDNMPV